MRSIRSILIFFCISVIVVAQDFTPIVKQFGKQDYGAANQNWSVAQDSRGLMYFANNQGLLQFDGNLWELYRMPQNKLVRSVFIDKQDRIYVGSFEEFGCFEKQQNGKLTYKSLSDSLKGYSMMNDEIWTIFEINNTVIFQSFTSYFTFKKGIVEGHRQPVTFLFFSPFGNDVLVNTKQHALCRLDLQKHQLIPFPQEPVKGEILTILPLDSKRYIAATVNDGLYFFDGRTFTRFKTDADDFLKQVVVNRAVITPDKNILLGTIRHGSLVDTPEGDWYVIYHGYLNGFRNLGRQTLMEPVQWMKDGWFSTVDSVDRAKPIQVNHKINLQKGRSFSDNFSTNMIGKQWQFYKKNYSDRCSFENQTLTIDAIGSKPSDFNLTFSSGDMAYEMEVDVAVGVGAKAGLILFYNESKYLGISFSNGSIFQEVDGQSKMIANNISNKDFIHLKIKNKHHSVSMHYSVDGKNWEKLDRSIDVEHINLNAYGQFTCLRPGIFVSGKGIVRFQKFIYSI